MTQQVQGLRQSDVDDILKDVVEITLVRNEHGDDEMHVTGCADIARKARTTISTGRIPQVYAGETLVDAIVAADTDMADWFCEAPYTESARENGCWMTTSQKWAPCFKAAVKAAGVEFDPTTFRPFVGTVKIKTTKTGKRTTVKAYQTPAQQKRSFKADIQTAVKASKVSKAENVRRALRAGATLTEIANDGDLGVTYAYAWDIKKAMEVKAFADEWAEETGEPCSISIAKILMEREADAKNSAF
jgi:hypothetical protein